MFGMTLELLERYVEYGPAFGAEEIEGEEVVGFNIGTLILNLEYKLYTDDDPIDVGRTSKATGLSEGVRILLLRFHDRRIRAGGVPKSLKKRVRKVSIRDGEFRFDRLLSDVK